MRPDEPRARPTPETGSRRTSAPGKAATDRATVPSSWDATLNLRAKVTLPDDQVRRLADLVRSAMADAGQIVEERRRLVLAHDDLAAKLTEEPVGYERPEQWNGYVPPLVWNGEFNDSPRRAALAEICAEALRRYGGHCPALDVT